MEKIITFSYNETVNDQQVSVLFKGKKVTLWLILRMTALRLEIILKIVITSWFEFFGCCLSRAEKQTCSPCNKLLTATTLRKPKVWSLLAGVRVFACQPFPQLEERCSESKTTEEKKKTESQDSPK